MDAPWLVFLAQAVIVGGLVLSASFVVGLVLAAICGANQRAEEEMAQRMRQACTLEQLRRDAARKTAERDALVAEHHCHCKQVRHE